MNSPYPTQLNCSSTQFSSLHSHACNSVFKFLPHSPTTLQLSLSSSPHPFKASIPLSPIGPAAAGARSGALSPVSVLSGAVQKIDVNPPKGTRDFSPEDMRLRNWLFNNFREIEKIPVDEIKKELKVAGVTEDAVQELLQVLSVKSLAELEELLKEKGLLPELSLQIDNIVCALDEDLQAAAAMVANVLREKGQSVDLVLENKPLKWVFKRAAQTNAQR